MAVEKFAARGGNCDETLQELLQNVPVEENREEKKIPNRGCIDNFI